MQGPPSLVRKFLDRLQNVKALNLFWGSATVQDSLPWATTFWYYEAGEQVQHCDPTEPFYVLIFIVM